MKIRGSSRQAAVARAAAAGACVAALIALPLQAETHHGRVGVAISAAGAATVPWTVEVTPPGPYVDGQALTITIKTTASNPVSQAETHVCRLGVDYQVSTVRLPNADFAVGGANCAAKPVSSSGQYLVIDSTVASNAATAAGSTSEFRVGQGTITWQQGGSGVSLTCDIGNPCALVTEVRGMVDGQNRWIPHIHELTFHNDDPLASCGGADPDILRSTGSDRFTDAYVNWTVADCARPGRAGAATQAVFTGEGLGLAAFHAGLSDIAYTGLGYHEGVFQSGEHDQLRPAVAVPLAINAAVLAAAGGYRTSDGRKFPFSSINLTLDEVTHLLSGGSAGITPHLADITARNPMLVPFVDDRAPFFVGATAEAESSSWIMTRHADTLRPAAFRVPDKQEFGAEAGRDRTVSANLALADPSFRGALSLFSGRPPLRKDVASLSSNSSGAMWVFTDAATAAALRLTPAAIENAAGAFVGPTPDAVRAGMTGGSFDGDGIFVPNPAMSGGGAPAYPMVYVEYALVPLQPLTEDDGCTVRPGSQDQLDDWLAYLVGDGQGQLPAGMLPLTPDLKTAATAALARVGTGALPSTCSVTTQGSPSTNGAGAGGGGGSGSGQVAAPSLGPSLLGGLPAASVPALAASLMEAMQQAVAAADGAGDDAAETGLISLPAFAGRRASGLGGLVVAVLGLLALSGCAALARVDWGPKLIRRRVRVVAPAAPAGTS